MYPGRRTLWVVFVWLVETFGLGPEDVRALENRTLRWTCENGHTEVAQWLVRTFSLGPDDSRCHGNYSLIHTCENGHLETARWLLDWIEPDAEELAMILSRIAEPLPAVVALLEGWSRPPGPEDKPAASGF